MRTALLAAALLAPSAAFACAMPHYEEKQLTQLMAEIDAATPTTPAPTQKAEAPKPDAATVIPEATTPPAATAPPTSKPRS